MIKNKAREIGFDLIGICDPEPLFNAYNILKNRKNNNILPAFISDDLNLLVDPRKHLENVNSIISLGLSYVFDSEDGTADARIALYARGEDYHHVLQEKMNMLCSYLKKLNKNVVTKSFTDTVPLLEKEIARKAGLGWIGKNNLLINEKYGSFIVLGEIFTDLKLEYDEPAEDKCGNCNKCISSCPTGALRKAYYLDPGICISYLTQKKGYLNEEEIKMMGKYLWGCDICQLSCPFNKDILKNVNDEFQPVLEADLREILKFKEFPDTWKNSAMSWRGLETIKRNAIIIMALSGQEKYLHYLLYKFKTNSSLLKTYAKWAIEELRSDKDD